MGAGLVIGGIILLVIGIGAYVYLGNLKGQAEDGQVLCHRSSRPTSFIKYKSKMPSS
ncbi:MAG: hypothetical protein WA395_08430 [Nitrososphaeraceae archaeon]